MVQFPEDSKNLFLSIIGGTIVALISIWIDLIRHISILNNDPNLIILVDLIGILILLIIFLLSFIQYGKSSRKK